MFDFPVWLCIPFMVFFNHTKIVSRSGKLMDQARNYRGNRWAMPHLKKSAWFCSPTKLLTWKFKLSDKVFDPKVLIIRIHTEPGKRGK